MAETTTKKSSSKAEQIKTAQASLDKANAEANELKEKFDARNKKRAEKYAEQAKALKEKITRREKRVADLSAENGAESSQTASTTGGAHRRHHHWCSRGPARARGSCEAQRCSGTPATVALATHGKRKRNPPPTGFRLSRMAIASRRQGIALAGRPTRASAETVARRPLVVQKGQSRCGSRVRARLALAAFGAGRGSS